MKRPCQAWGVGVGWLLAPAVTAVAFNLFMLWQIPASAQAPAEPNYKTIDAAAPTKAETKAFNDLFTRETNPGQVQPGDAATIKTAANFRLAEFTQVGVIVGGPDALVRKRGDIKQFLGRAGRLPVKDLHVAMNREIIATAMPMVNDKDVHPAARYNLLYLVGQLDRVEREGAAPPIPLPEGTMALVDVLGKNDVPAYLHVAALDQLVRHAEYEMPSAQRTAVVGAIKPLLLKEAPANADPAAWQWSRKRAANIVQLMAEKTYNEVNDPALLVAVSKLLTDNKATLNMRSDAALAIAGCEGRWLAATTQVRQMAAGVGEALKASMNDCADSSKTNPMFAHVLYYMACYSESLRKPETTKGLLAAAGNDAELKSAINGMSDKITEFEGKVRKLVAGNQRPETTALTEPGRALLRDMVTQLDQIMAPLNKVVAQAKN